jgi:hypothetical protein
MYRGLFFRKVAYTRYDVAVFVAWMDFTVVIITDVDTEQIDKWRTSYVLLVARLLSHSSDGI